MDYLNMEINSNLMQQRQLIKRLVSEQKYSVAYNILSKILAQYPTDYEILSHIGYVCYKMQSYNESLMYYKQCIDINNIEIENSFVSNWFYYHQYGKLLHISHDMTNAKTYYIKSLKLNNYNLPIYYDIAKLYIDTKNYSESATYFEQYFDLFNAKNTPNKIISPIQATDLVHFKYAKLLFYKLEKRNNGKTQMLKAIDLKPQNCTYSYEFALMLKLTESIKKAKKYFMKCIQFSNYKNDKYLYEYGLFLTDTLKDTKNGMSYVKKAYDLKPNNAQYKNEYFALKNWNSTAQAHTTKNHKKWNAKHSNSHSHHSNNNREIYNSIKRNARRIKFDDSSYHPNNSIDWDKICGTNNKYTDRIIEFKEKFSIACQAQAEHNYVLAKNILEDLIRIAPEDGEIFGRYAFALAQLNNLFEAETFYKKSLILSPRNYVTMYNYAFLLYYKLARYESAEFLYKKCLKIKPNCAKALLNYARLLDTIKKKKLSEQYYRMCLSGSPNYDLCFYYFGCFLYRQERYQEAKYFLQKAVDCWPHSHLHHFRLAVTCHVLCEYNKCQFHLKESLRIRPNFIAATEAYQRYGYHNRNGNGNGYKRNVRYVKKKNGNNNQRQTDSDTTATHSTNETTELTDSDSSGNGSKGHLRMYDPIRRNHRFNIDERWSNDYNNMNSDRNFFVNWLKSIRIYDSVKNVFRKNNIQSMKQFHARITSKKALIGLLKGSGMRQSKNEIANVIWQSAPKKV